MKATIRGTEIYFDVAGMQVAPKGKEFVEQPVIFMLHGGPGSDHLRYKQHSLELAKVAQLIFIDHRGCGRSKKTKAADYTLKNNIEDVEALRKYLGLKKIIILGTSYGGIVAQGYAIKYPKNLDKLILVATAPSYHSLKEAKEYIMQHGSSKQIEICQSLWKGNFKNSKQVEKFFKIMDPLYSTVLAQRKYKAPVGKTNTVWSYQALNKGFNGFLRHYNFIPKLKTIKCPTLILAGREDWICSANQSKIIAKHIPNANLKIFRNCSHAVAVDAHTQYIKAIEKFIVK